MNANLSKLLEKANALPLRSGIYVMKDSGGKVIYVGKSRKLKNRVSQYFHDHAVVNVKTAKMVERVADFDYILCDNEIEALTLENSLIKQYSPKYNIKLKDAKSYPYIKVNVKDEYPTLSMTRSRSDDRARYFGPYSSTATVYDVIGTLEKTLRLPSCKRSFPKDIGVGRPCIYSQIGRCMAPCAGKVSGDEYRAAIKCALDILDGDISSAKNDLERQMYEYSDNMQFEAAARCRDSIEALKRLRDRQKVVTSPDRERDVIALYSCDTCSVVSVFYIRGGAITDSEHFNFPASEILEPENMPAFMGQLYARREYLPHEVLTHFELPEDEREALEGYLKEISGHAVHIHHPERGELKALCSLAYDNAVQNATHYEKENEDGERAMVALASALSLEVVPERIEAYDISNLGSEHTVAGMVVMKDGKFAKSDYRVFNIGTVDGQDDYAAMRETLSRRLRRAMEYEEGDSFPPPPDLILLDGGKGHVSVIKSLMAEMGCDIPVYGMVKDDFHKSRAITDGEREISIARDQTVYTLIYRLQEEVHRFSVSHMQGAKRKTLKTSTLERIKGIGPEKAKILLAEFGSLTAIKTASTEELAKVKGISASDAAHIAEYFGKPQERLE